MKQKMLINGEIIEVDTCSHYCKVPVIEDHVEITTVDTIEKTGDGPNDFIIKKEVVETLRCDNREYIESFKDLVGIDNIVAKASLPGNAGLLNQVKGQYLNIPSVPSDTASQKAIIANGQKAASDAGFSFTEEGLKEMMAKAVADALASKENTGGNE